MAFALHHPSITIVMLPYYSRMRKEGARESSLSPQTLSILVRLIPLLVEAMVDSTRVNEVYGCGDKSHTPSFIT